LFKPLNTKEDCREIKKNSYSAVTVIVRGDPFDIIKDGREPAKYKILEKKNRNVE
jgi:hypothetical protein